MSKKRISNKITMRDIIERLQNQLLDEIDFSCKLQCQMVDHGIMPIKRSDDYRYINKEELNDE